MKVLILAAGKGVRMRPLTLEKPKPLIEVNGRPFISYIIDTLFSAGVKDMAVVVNYKKQMIMDFFAQNGIDAVFIDQKHALGTGHAVMQAREWTGQEEFIVVNGDCLYSKEDIKRFAVRDGKNYIGVIEHNHPERYGVVVENNGMLEHIMEKPEQYVGSLVNTGLYKFTPEIFDALEKIKKSKRGEYELTDAVTLIAKSHGVNIIRLKYWLELGRVEDIKKIEMFLRGVHD